MWVVFGAKMVDIMVVVVMSGGDSEVNMMGEEKGEKSQKNKKQKG